jgi:hypothetical protein
MDKHDRKVSVTMFYCVGLYGYVPTHGIGGYDDIKLSLETATYP